MPHEGGDSDERGVKLQNTRREESKGSIACDCSNIFEREIMEDTSKIKTQYRVDRIPPELIDVPKWLVWKPELRDGKWTEVPYCPHDPTCKAKISDPKTWDTFQGAVGAASAYWLERQFPSLPAAYIGASVGAILYYIGSLRHRAIAVKPVAVPEHASELGTGTR